MTMEGPSEEYNPPPSPIHVYYPSVHVRHPNGMNVVNARRVRIHPYQPSPGSSSQSRVIRRRDPPPTNVVFNFNHNTRVEDPMIGSGSSPASGHPPPNEPWSLSSLPSHTTSSHSPRGPVASTSTSGGSTTVSGADNDSDNDNDNDVALSLAQSFFPDGTPDHAQKQVDMYAILTSPWKQNNEFEPSADTLLRFATREDGFWRCTFYVGGRRCERSMTDRNRQIIEHIRRHIKLEPYICEGTPW